MKMQGPVEEKKDWRASVAFILMFINVVTLNIFFGGKAFDPNTISAQVVMRLVLYAITSAFALINYRLWVGRMFRVDVLLFTMLMIWMVITCFWSPIMNYSLAIAFTFWANICLVYTAASLLNERQLITILAGAATLISAASIIVYFAFPSIGRMHGYINGVYTESTRMSGVTGTANGVGGISAFACLLIVCYRLYLAKSLPRSFIVMFAINLVAQLMSNDRSAVAAFVFAIGVATIMRATPLKVSLLFLGVCAIAALVTVVNLNALMAMLSRSGDASEIMTATGRIFIWKQAWAMSNLRPLTGYGYGSDGFIMPHFDHPAPHAHNLGLQLLFTMGYPGLIMGLGAYLVKFYYAVKFRDQFKITLTFCSLIGGLTEPGAFHGPAGMAAIFLGIIMVFPYHPSFERRRPYVPPALPQTESVAA